MDFKYLRMFCVFPFALLTACGGGSGGKSSNPDPSPASQPPVSSSSLQSSLAASSSSTANEVVGMDAQPANKTCLAPEPVEDATGVISWKPAFPNLPVISKGAFLFQLPGDNAHWYVARQFGVITRFDNNADASEITTVLDIDDRVDSSGNEMGLLSVAPHPAFLENRHVFLFYTGRNASDEIETRIARYTVNTDGTFDKNSESLILSFTRPYANHVGGQLAFDKDGLLYIASGDGGSAGDPHGNGQKLDTLLGKILRIDIDRKDEGKNYAIPADNPFINSSAKPEIWAYGLRNPWRFSFDKSTNDLWVGDVGQDAWEEVNLVTRGGNYGWNDMEGDSCFKLEPDCSTANKIKPVLSISQSTGACSVIGGFVYRGNDYPAAKGKYFFTDYCEHTMRSLTRSSGGVVKQAEHGTTVTSIVSFAQDNRGELFALGQGSAAGQQIYKMEATGANPQAGTMARSLSATGCVDAANPTRAADGLIPYRVESALWSDGAEKERYLGIPENTKVGVTTNGDIDFPVGSVLMKHFKFGEKFVETRLFAHGELGWQGFSYEWNDAQTDATLLSEAKDKVIDGISWHFPSPGQCLECHTAIAGFSLGLETKQLNGPFIYPVSQTAANQLTTLSHIGLFTAPLSSAHKNEKLFGIEDAQASVEQKARSYLHTNCSNCHQPDGPTPVTLDLRSNASLAQMNACNVAPTAGDLGVSDPKLIAPGEPLRSVLLKRMQATDDSKMPPLARNVVDAKAVQVVSDWIAGLTTCN